ncbi:hypothetical protein F5148DRAFT_1275780 [Russula earlei]|uniref:Uncharacterized protein n=1 Tax=Russula earlei TaxID=71964 RepID=A0ACC0UB83_9AGAM|nr:hypothetical protein F5148DRAFT_1275780 [Russula earlei]
MTAQHRYRGHRRRSFICADVGQLVELRAHQRTYDGAYMRTALGMLGYSLTVLRLFDRHFYRIGLVFAILAFLLCACAFFRARHTRHNYVDGDNADDPSNMSAIPTVGQEHMQSFGRPFITAGRIVALVACVVAATEIALFILIFLI